VDHLKLFGKRKYFVWQLFTGNGTFLDWGQSNLFLEGRLMHPKVAVR